MNYLLLFISGMYHALSLTTKITLLALPTLSAAYYFRNKLSVVLEKFLLAATNKVISRNIKIKALSEDISITESNYDEEERFLEFLAINRELLDHEDALREIFNQLYAMERFIKFGFHKIIMVLVNIDGKIYSFHHNVVINNNTTFEQYYEKVRDHIRSKFDDGYEINTADKFIVKIWNIVDLRNSNIKQTKTARSIIGKDLRSTVEMGPSQIRYIATRVEKTADSKYINPLANKDKIKSFFTLDIETMKGDDGNQHPVFISFSSSNRTEFFLIDRSLDLNLGINDLWFRFFDFLTSTYKNKINTIFIHNLGGFDGIFLYKYLCNNYTNDQLKVIIDDANRFICISLKLENYEYVFKDSYRIFPCSLDELCNIFSVQGKIGSYRSEFNSFELFSDKRLLKELIEYGKQDTRGLYNALKKAQNAYFKNYSVDITSIVSIPSLAFKIFRLNYLDKKIPVVRGLHDTYIRRSYQGGATDIYKCYAENLHYYDVNSLYPAAMCKPMPLELLNTYGREDLCKHIDINNFFGFLEVEIECPSSISKPVLPYRIHGRTIFPVGIFTGVYFSEELKAVLPLGYKINKILSAREFSKGDLFTKYVSDMYSIKQNSKGAERWIAKLLLNSLYGLFGRKQDLLETLIIPKSELRLYLICNIVKNYFPISEGKYAILIYRNINQDVLDELSIKFSMKFKQFEKTVKSNVAIASAITSYARISMIPFKLDDGVCYTDTDSIFTTTPIDNSLIGPELVKIKDELDGGVINQAYFLGIKQYGFWYYNQDSTKTEKSVWAGVTRDSLSFEDIISLKQGNTINRTIDNRFFKSIVNLTITIKSATVTIEFKPHKKLVGNIYLPNIIYKPKISSNVAKFMFYIKYCLIKIWREL